jgi:hypothetical protein
MNPRSFLRVVTVLLGALLFLSTVKVQAAPPTSILIYEGPLAAKSFMGSSYYDGYKPGSIRAFVVLNRFTGECQTVLYGRNTSGGKKGSSTQLVTLNISNINGWPDSFLVLSGQHDGGTFFLMNYLRGKNGPTVDLNNSGGNGAVPAKMKFLQRDIGAVSAWLGEANGTLELDLTRSRANNDEYRTVSDTVNTLALELQGRGFLFGM